MFTKIKYNFHSFYFVLFHKVLLFFAAIINEIDSKLWNFYGKICCQFLSSVCCRFSRLLSRILWLEVMHVSRAQQLTVFWAPSAGNSRECNFNTWERKPAWDLTMTSSSTAEATMIAVIKISSEPEVFSLPSHHIIRGKFRQNTHQKSIISIVMDMRAFTRELNWVHPEWERKCERNGQIMTKYPANGPEKETFFSLRFHRFLLLLLLIVVASFAPVTQPLYRNQYFWLVSERMSAFQTQSVWEHVCVRMRFLYQSLSLCVWVECDGMGYCGIVVAGSWEKVERPQFIVYEDEEAHSRS